MGASRKRLTRTLAVMVGMVMGIGSLVGWAGPAQAADTVDVNFTQLLFNHTTVNTNYVNVKYSTVATSGMNNGDIVLWKSLATINGVTIDAIVTTSLSAMTLSTYGSGGAGTTNDFQTNTTVTGTAGGYADFQFTFCEGGTSVVTNPGVGGSINCGNPLTLENVQVTGLDIDGSGAAQRQFNTFTPVLSDTVTDPTNLTVTRTPADSQPYEVKFLGATGARANLPQDQAVVGYSSIASATIRMGAETTGASISGTAAFFALRWKAQAFCLTTVPFTCYSTTTTGQSATVNYNINGGSGTTPDSVSGIFGEVKGTVATGAAFSKPGFTFVEWNTAPDGSGAAVAAGSPLTIPAGSTTYYAVWAGTYAITYDGNGATSGSAPPDGSYTTGGSAYTIAGNTGTLAREGYTFAGWNTSADGSGTTYVAGSTYAASADLPLFALWTPTSATLRVKVVSDGPQVYGGRVAEDYDGVEVELSRNGGAFDYKPMQVTDAAGEVDFGSVDINSSYTVRLKAPCDSRPVVTPASLAVEAGPYAPTFQLAATVPCQPTISYDAGTDTLSWTQPNDGGSTIRYYTYNYNTPARVTAGQPWYIAARYWPAEMLSVPFATYANATPCPAKGTSPAPDPYPNAPQCYRALGSATAQTYWWRVGARNALDEAGTFTSAPFNGAGQTGLPGKGWSQNSTNILVTR